MENGRYSLSGDNESPRAAYTPGERRRIDWQSLINARRGQPDAAGRSAWSGARLSKAEKAGVLGMVAVVFLIAGLVITSGGTPESNALNPDSEASKVKWALDQQHSPENVTPVPKPEGADRTKDLDELFKTKFPDPKLVVAYQANASNKGASKKTATT